MAAAGVVSGKVSNGRGERPYFSLGWRALLLGGRSGRDAKAILYLEQRVAGVRGEDLVVSAVFSSLPAQSVNERPAPAPGPARPRLCSPLHCSGAGGRLFVLSKERVVASFLSFFVAHVFPDCIFLNLLF